MINLGEIEDPITRKPTLKAESAEVFIELLEVLEEKTRGNLTEGEEHFLLGSLENLKRIYREKFKNEEGN